MTQDEKLRVLKLLEDGKISKTQADELITALNGREMNGMSAPVDKQGIREEVSIEEENELYKVESRLHERESELREKEAALRDDEARLREEEERLRDELSKQR